MKLRIFLAILAGCLMLSACGAAETTPETGAAVPKTHTKTPETMATVQENRYQDWDYYNGYACMIDGNLRYWLEFSDEFYLHCMFRSGSSEYYEVVYTLYPDWDAPTAQELTIQRVTDAEGNDITNRFERLVFAFSSEDYVLMQAKRNESTLAGGEEDNILTGDYTFLPR